MTINQLQDEIIEEFADIDDWMDRYAYIIDMGNALPPTTRPIAHRSILSRVARAVHGYMPN